MRLHPRQHHRHRYLSQMARHHPPEKGTVAFQLSLPLHLLQGLH
jgi:hypothetical protein